MTTLKARRCPCGNTFIPRAADDRHCSACWHAVGISPHCPNDGTCCGESDEGPEWAADDPLVKGGQGRTDGEADAVASALAVYVGAFLCVCAIATLYLLLDAALRGGK